MTESCGTCRHWKPLGGSETEWRWPELVEPLDDPWGSCSLIEDPNGSDQRGGVIAYTQDGSDYWSTLRCRASFGCVLHEQMEREARGGD